MISHRRSGESVDVALGRFEDVEIQVSSGYAIFLTGVPSSGKTTLAQRLESELPGFLALSGDETIRRMSAKTGDSAHGLFVQLLDLVESRLATKNLIVDMSLPGSYVTEARSRLGRAALFVALRLPEADRAAREAGRGDRPPISWNPSLTAKLGSDNLYDLVVNTSERSPQECARDVREKAAELWRDLSI